jgi:16S rRNA (cytidine1402-2'-O)-methyltransferase
MNPATASQPSIMPVMHDVAQQVYPASSLYVLATPIGNAGDITLRGIHVLSLVDAVACEDTRNTVHLLTRYGLSKPLIAAHQHNEREIAEQLIRRLQSGERIALVSDAGTPAVSDPGARIIDAVRQAGLRVIPIPGASAAVTALSASGLVNDRFCFIGFLPAKAKQRETELMDLRSVNATLVFYEAPHRVEESVDAIMQVFEPTRQIVIARELTKLFEEIHRCALSEAKAWLQARSERQKGEFVLLVEGAPPTDEASAEATRILRILLEACPVSQAAALAAKITGQKKNALYQQALEMQHETDKD